MEVVATLGPEKELIGIGVHPNTKDDKSAATLGVICRSTLMQSPEPAVEGVHLHNDGHDDDVVGAECMLLSLSESV